MNNTKMPPELAVTDESNKDVSVNNPSNQETQDLDCGNEDDEKIVVEQEEKPPRHISHFRNPSHPAVVRYGLTVFMLVNIAIYVVGNIGSGVRADFMFLRQGEISQRRALLSVSIVESVKELWNNGSYPLAILIAATSVAWPYVKIMLSIWGWLVPYRVPRKHETLIEVTDALDKWSFVDIVVLVEIMVAFR